MAWGDHSPFPRAIIHVDGDAFFASCEIAKNPSLRGKPVITGKERGIVSAASYEAKARGVIRGSKLSDALRACPDAVILPSDYETYSIFSHRMYEIVRRYTPDVEEYSIDECFADITGMRRTLHASYPEITARIKTDLERELGMTFSLGLSVTKVLAKVGSKWKKPSGLTVIARHDIRRFLEKLPVGHVWGIGPNTTQYLAKYGVRTAADFAGKSKDWVDTLLTKPSIEIWYELRGEQVLQLDTEGRHSYQSISKTKTFTPPSRDAAFIFSQLSKNIENACIKLRRWNLEAAECSFFLKTQDMRYRHCTLPLLHPSNVPQEVLALVTAHFPQVYRKGELYRASGITMLKLRPVKLVQLDMFGAVLSGERVRKVYEKVDTLSERYGKHAVFLGASFTAMTHAQHAGGRGDMPLRTGALFKGESSRRRLNIPFMGEVG